MRTRVSRYKILKQLHSGATADLLLGIYENDGAVRYAALKQIRAEHAKDPRFLQKFLGEVQRTIALGHEHLVEVHDVLGTDGDYIVAMEYVHGADLRTLVASAAQRGSYLPVELMCEIASAVAAGLHHAHELRDDNRRSLGVLHRNISPSNILIGYDGSIKLGDFGSSRASMLREGDADDIAGRTSYFSPEQCKREELDRRSDVYSLGVVLYELATTARLFTGDSDEQVMERILGGDVVSPRNLRPDLPGELAAILLRAIAVDPADRYATAGELHAAIDQFAGRGKRAPASSIATYLRKVVGERAAPWLSDDAVAEPAFVSGNTWIEPPRDSREDWSEVSRMMPHPGHAVSAAAGAEASTGSTVEQPGTAAPLVAPVPPPPVAVRGGGAARLAMIGAPLIAIAGFAVWRFALVDSPRPQVASVSASAPALVRPPAEPSSTVRSPAVVPAPSAEPAPSAVPTVPKPAPVAAVDPGPAHEPAGAPDSTHHLARTPEPVRSSKSHAAPPVKRPATEKIAEAAPTSAPAPSPPPEPVPTPPLPTAPPVAPPVSAPVTSAPVPTARPASNPPPAPAPTPAPVVMARVIQPLALDANRVAGAKDIAPDGATLLEIRRAHKDKITATFKLCVNTEGMVSTITALQGTGFDSFDAKIENTIRDKWRYRPFVIDGQRSSVCTKVGFVYWPPVL